MFVSAGWVMVVPITDVVKMTLSVADISVEPIIGTPLNIRIFSGKNFTSIALVVQSVGVTKIKNNVANNL